MESIKSFSKEELKKHNVVIMTHKEIYDIFDKIEIKLMKKYHHAIQTSAIVEWVLERCALNCEGVLYVFKDRFDYMLNIYKKGEVSSPFDLKTEPFNVLGRMFAEGEVSEC